MHSPHIITEVSSAASIRSKFELLSKSDNPIKSWRNFFIKKNIFSGRQTTDPENASQSESNKSDSGELVKQRFKELKKIKSTPSNAESSHILKSEILIQEGSNVSQAKVGECCQQRTESDVVTLSRRVSIMPSISCDIPDGLGSKCETLHDIERNIDCAESKITSTSIRRFEIQESVYSKEIIVDRGSLSGDDHLPSESDEVFEGSPDFVSTVPLKCGRVTSMLPHDESLAGLDYLEQTPFQNLEEILAEHEAYPHISQTITFQECPKMPTKADENLYEEIENDDDDKCSMNSTNCQVSQITKRVEKVEQIQISKTQDDQLEKIVPEKRIQSAMHSKGLKIRISEADSISSDSTYISSSESERFISRSGSIDQLQNFDDTRKKTKDDPIELKNKECSSDVGKGLCRSISISISLVTSRNDKFQENSPKRHSIKTTESAVTAGVIDDSFGFLNLYD